MAFKGDNGIRDKSSKERNYTGEKRVPIVFLISSFTDILSLYGFAPG